MGLFSKEACAICGAEVGMMNRSKLASKEYVCGACRKKTHEFLRTDYVTLDEFKEIMEETPKREQDFAAFNKGTTLSPSMGVGKTLRLYMATGADETDEFCFHTPDTKKYGNRYIFSFFGLKPYDSTTKFDWSVEKIEMDKDYITLEEKKSGDKVEGYYLCFPYNDKAIRNVRLDLEDMKKEDAEYMVQYINTVRNRIMKGLEDSMRNKQELHQKNLTATANAALKAAVTGKDVTEALKEGMERSQDIDEGRIKKKGFFAKLFGKKDLDRD